jgi:hypothetical protein
VARLRVGGAVSRLDRETLRAPVLRSGGEFPKRLGRAVLWLLILVLLLRGIAGVVGASQEHMVVRTVRMVPASWPGDEARAFAVGFARAFLTSPPSASSLQAFVGPDLASTVVPQAVAKGRPQSVIVATVARTAVVDRQHVLITVAAVVSGKSVSTRYLTVPVARDGSGGLVVDDLPSFAAAPPRAQPPEVDTEPLPATEAGAIGDVLTHFFRSFLAGRADDLQYFAPPGVWLGAPAQAYVMQGTPSLAVVGPTSGSVRTVLVAVQARDAQTGVTYPLRYRMRMVRRDRWYVAAINSSRRG